MINPGDKKRLGNNYYIAVSDETNTCKECAFKIGSSECYQIDPVGGCFRAKIVFQKGKPHYDD